MTEDKAQLAHLNGNVNAKGNNPPKPINERLLPACPDLVSSPQISSLFKCRGHWVRVHAKVPVVST